MSDKYNILKVPVSREKQVFYYYKQYVPSEDQTNKSLQDPPPSDRSLYIVHFDQAIREDFLQKTFGHFCGPLAQSLIGYFRPKASKKKQKRTVYFAILTFKSEESLAQLLKDPKIL